MKLTGTAALLLASTASAITVSWDAGYDDDKRSLTAVACSDGDNGLMRYGYSTQGSIPGWPNIGGSSDIAGWNSAQCGQCYTVTYNGVSINIVGIDHAAEGLNLSKQAMNKLTGGRADEKGRVDAVVTKVDSGVCGLRASKRSIEFMA